MGQNVPEPTGFADRPLLLFVSCGFPPVDQSFAAKKGRRKLAEPWDGR